MSLLRRVPLPPTDGTLIDSAGRVFSHRHDQVVCWVSLGLRGEPPAMDPFPALLDSGFNDWFLMSAAQVVEFGGPVAAFGAAKRGYSLLWDGERQPCFELDVWIHPNIDGRMDRDVDAAPVRLEFQHVTFQRHSGVGRRTLPLPLLGMNAARSLSLRVVIENGHLSVDRDASSATIRP